MLAVVSNIYWYLETCVHSLAISKSLCCCNSRLSWWRHQMETFSALLAICAGNSPVPVNSPHKGQWCGALMFSLICARINEWVNNREAGDLIRHRGHYDVNVMYGNKLPWCLQNNVFCTVFVPCYLILFSFYDPRPYGHLSYWYTFLIAQGPDN